MYAIWTFRWYAGDTWTEQRMHWKGSEAYTAVQTKLDEAVRLEGEAQITTWQELFDLLSEQVPHASTFSAMR